MKLDYSPKLITLKKFKDSRGSLSRIFCINQTFKKGFDISLKQINFVNVKRKATIKGMHMQLPPYTEVKTVSVIKGKIFDVILDLRKGSKNFLKWKSYIMSSNQNKSLIIPKGFAHGFQTLTDECEILYCHSEIYKSKNEISINPFDTSVKIKWPIKVSNISIKDKKAKYIFNDFKGIVI